MSTEPVLTLPAARRWRFPWVFVGLVAVLAGFGWGVVHLLELRFETGDVYPPYSTLRSDPLGAAAFYEALEGQPGLRVERNLRPLEHLTQGPMTPLGSAQASPTPDAAGTGRLTCFYLGADPYEWPGVLTKEEADSLETILNNGGRVVLTFLPGETPLTEARLERNRHGAGPSPSPAGRKLSAREKRQLEEMEPADLVKRWSIDFARTGPKSGVRGAIPNLTHNPFALPTPRATPSATPRATPSATPGGTPRPGALVKGRTAVPSRRGAFADAGPVSWHTALDFDPATPGASAAGWRALYLRDGKPVIAARPFGAKGGELILASDSYFLSNEALRAEPHPALLAALVGDARRVVFDESHHGLRESPGLMTLARRYGLQGALAATGLLVALFIWRNVVSLVPPAPAGEDVPGGSTVTGRDAAAGFLNLVRRGVPARDLLATCVTQWQAGAGRRAPDAATVARLRALAAEEAARPSRDRALAGTYRAMCAAAKPGR